jgi:NitT/TauT family transport system substrate-binding protein
MTAMPTNPSRKKGLLLLAVLALAAGVTLFLVFRGRPAPDLASLRFAQLPISYSAVTQIAELQGYFREEGLDSQVISLPAGPDIVTALRASGGSAAQAGGIAVTPVVTMIGAGGHPVIVATTLTSNSQAKLVTFANSGITKDPATLKGKRIGVVRNTVGEIYLDRLLKKGGLRSQDVVLVNGRPADLRTLLVRGDVDAAVLWDPFVIQVEREYRRLLAEGKTPPRGEPQILVDPTLYTLAFNIVTTSDKLPESREALLKMLRATIKAERYMREHPKEAQAALEKWLNLEPGDLGDFFATTEFRVQINVPQLKQWCKEELEELRAGRPDTQVPEDLSPYIDASLLRSIDPGRVHE